jgi:hypothetical protein
MSPARSLDCRRFLGLLSGGNLLDGVVDLLDLFEPDNHCVNAILRKNALQGLAHRASQLAFTNDLHPYNALARSADFLPLLPNITLPPADRKGVARAKQWSGSAKAATNAPALRIKSRRVISDMVSSLPKISGHLLATSRDVFSCRIQWYAENSNTSTHASLFFSQQCGPARARPRNREFPLTQQTGIYPGE